MTAWGIVGSRRRNSRDDLQACDRFMAERLKEGDRIVSGGCPSGGDRFAEIIARRRQFPITIHYARWNDLGKGAGFVRNTDIARECDELVALPAEDRTGGTEDTIRKAMAMGKIVHLI